MDFPRPSKSASELFGDLKERINTRVRKPEVDDYYDEQEYYEDEFPYEEGPADDYGPYGYEDENIYDRYDQYEQTAAASSPRARVEERYGVGGNGIRSPHLVSVEDVRATTSLYGVAGNPSKYAPQDGHHGGFEPTQPLRASDYLNSKPDAQDSDSFEAVGYDKAATSYSDFVSPYKRNTAHDGRESMIGSAAAENRTQGAFTAFAEKKQPSGLDKLFTPTTDAGQPADQVAAAIEAAPTNAELYPHNVSRKVETIKPVNYDDVAGIAAIVREGNIAILSLRVTNDVLSRRVLDFSFGVASALEAQVDFLGQKSYAIYRGKELSLEEKHELRKLGVL